jgi:hypothetical protein
MVSIDEDSRISLGGHGEYRRSNLMKNNNICTFSLITTPKKPPVSPLVMINVKQCMVGKIFFVFQWWRQKKVLEPLV